MLKQCILEHNHAQNVAALADELNLPQFPSILRHYLHSQLHPTDPHDPDDIPLDECPLYDGTLRVYNSACATLFAPSDLSGVYGMRREHIHSCPMWRSEGPHFDCALVVTDLQAEGMRSLDVASDGQGSTPGCQCANPHPDPSNLLPADPGVQVVPTARRVLTPSR